jgi:ectoine hydroxylase-related dioxygenase (phytanoyl-CoA dioxygenase family)
MSDELDRNGYVVIEEALDAPSLARLSSAVDAVWRSERPNGAELHRLAFVGLDSAFVELVDHPLTLPLVTAALGWNIHMYHCHLDVHPPRPAVIPPVWRWHQDGGRQNVELASPRPRLSVKVAYFLTDVDDADSGAMWLIPGSHLQDSLERPADGGVRPRGALPLLVRAGTAVVFDRRLWHARGENVSPNTRKALFYAYTHRWIQPRDDLGLGERFLAGLDPVRRQLLGAATDATARWIPTQADVPLRKRATF